MLRENPQPTSCFMRSQNPLRCYVRIRNTPFHSKRSQNPPFCSVRIHTSSFCYRDCCMHLAHCVRIRNSLGCHEDFCNSLFESKDCRRPFGSLCENPELTISFKASPGNVLPTKFSQKSPPVDLLHKLPQFSLVNLHCIFHPPDKAFFQNSLHFISFHCIYIRMTKFGSFVFNYLSPWLCEDCRHSYSLGKNN